MGLTGCTGCVDEMGNEIEVGGFNLGAQPDAKNLTGGTVVILCYVLHMMEQIVTT